MTTARVAAFLVLAVALSGSAAAFADDDAAKVEAETAKVAAILARVLVKDRIDKACTDAGLNKCEHITEGVLLFLENKPEVGKLNLRDAAQANTPEQVRAFAQLISAIGDFPGADVISQKVVARTNSGPLRSSFNQVRETRDEV